MENKVKEQTQRHYAALVDKYTREYQTNYENYPSNQKRLRLIQDRLRVLRPKSLLDCGCGEGTPVLQIGEMGIDIWAFDFVEGMIQKAKKNANAKGLSDRFWVGDITLPDFGKPLQTKVPHEYDVCIALGVFPHIPDDLLALRNMASVLRPGGRVFVEFRNELFSLYTLNRYHYEFFDKRLIQFGALKRRFAEHKELLTQIEDEISRPFRMDLPPVRKGDSHSPSYDEILSKFHNPLEMEPLFSQVGLRIEGNYFYHYHALPPMYEVRNPDAFRKMSLEMENNYRDWRGYFMASAFVVEAIKETR